MASWTEANEKSVYLVMDGSETPYKFEDTTPLRDAVKSVAEQKGLGNVLVKHDGNTIEPSEGMKTLAELGKIEIMPKHAGAI